MMWFAEAYPVNWSTSDRFTTTTSWTKPTPAAALRPSTPSGVICRAILAGDFLLARASEIAASLGTEVAGLLARTIGWLCEGQIEELRFTYDVSRTEDSYYTSIHGKTASLYGTAARIGGIVAGHTPETIDALTEFGNAYGMVFQIVDDVLDATATDEQLGKPAGT